MSIRAWVVRFLGHTRFVPTPLYRLMVLGMMIAGISQAIWGAPASVSDNSPHYFDLVFVALTLVGGAITLTGLYLVEGNTRNAERLHASFNLELLGLIFIQTAISINVAGVVVQLGTPPTSSGTWMQIMFWTWGWFRGYAILRTTKELTR